MRDPEYDGFGPWILEITEADPIPPIFISHIERTEAPLFQIKIPRAVERRDLSPGMHMYDYLITLYNDDMVVHERHGDDVITVTFTYDEIYAIRHSEDLLDGRLFIYRKGGIYDIPYNTVSADIIQRLIAIIRQRYTPHRINSHPYSSLTDGYKASRRMDFYFAAYLNSLHTKKAGFRVLATQAETQIREFTEGFWNRLYYGIVDKRLLESIHISDGRELQIIGRGRTWGYRWQVVYGREILYLPIDNIHRCTRTTDLRNKVPECWTFHTGVARHQYLLSADNPDRDRYSEGLEILGLKPVDEGGHPGGTSPDLRA